MSGIEFLRVCKQEKDLASIPFLMVTSQSSMERMKVMQAARANVDEYLLKPFTTADLKKRIETIMSRAESSGEVSGVVVEALDHFDGGRFQRAQSLFEEALAIDPDNDVALRGYGDVLAKVRGLDSALPYYRKSIESNPANPKGYLRLAHAYVQMGWLDKALALLQNAMAQISFNADLHYQMGVVHMKRGDNAAAKAEFDKTLELQLDHPEAKLMLETLAQNRKV